MGAHLYKRTVDYGNKGCVFGCHVKQSNGTNDQYANEYLAHSISPTITLRIDSAITAIQTIINDAKNASGQNQNIKIGVYTMNLDPTVSTPSTITTISDPTADYASLTNLVATKIKLGNNVAGGTGDTDLSSQLTKFNSSIPTNGTEASASSPQNYIFIVSDAVTDKPGSGTGCSYNHCVAALSKDDCTSLKLKAIVGTIYTTYLPIYNNNDPNQGLQVDYKNFVAPIASQLAPNMQSCATSKDYYYEASDGPALNAAMQKLFASTLNTARLTK